MPNTCFSSYANPNLAMSDCYIEACRIALVAGRCSGMVSRVRVSVKAVVRDRCAKELRWYGCSVFMAE